MTTTFKFSPPSGIPRMIQRGEDQTLEIFWYEGETLNSVGVTSATFTLKKGSQVIIDNVAATTIGGPSTSATYDLNGTDTEKLSLGDDMLEIWVLNGTYLGQPVKLTARRSGHLVRTILYPMITDNDLVVRHQRLNDIRPPGLSDFSTYRDLAWEMINRDLIKKGRRPELILDSFSLVDMHVYKSLSLIFRDAITFVGDGRYSELAEMYERDYAIEWDKVEFHYDRNENDSIDQGEEAASPSIWLSEPPPGYPSTVVVGIDDV